jgi:hypothetical protein
LAWDKKDSTMTPYFTLDECKYILNLSTSLTENYRDDSDRGISYTFWSIGNSKSFKWIFDRFDLFLESQHSNLKVLSQLDAIHLFRYKTGNKFIRHKDIYYENQAYNVGVNLTDDYQGGEFLLYNPDYVLEKQAGKMYQFYHTREHEVTEIMSGERWSLIGFYFYNNINIKKPLL